MNGFRVYLNGKFLDEVFFSKSMTLEEAKKSLIEHDGYPADITVVNVRV